jgi:hypothetical protein
MDPPLICVVRFAREDEDPRRSSRAGSVGLGIWAGLVTGVEWLHTYACHTDDSPIEENRLDQFARLVRKA